ncbi:hypothetical protein VOLCADRAFT_106476 [Volvox carteri f. nagariensis]|uniref:Uncharacterized protein n=1 Tax=Volvox carteri f. nagariensis TaxID=3068 RepID=D8U7N1_VOLCA|nr:uncharacterized protein VOLCADRAFT_106476 [Volvox carteri f. nagariensis]EFJ44330.1 hypothetical protein VOLCADRAFT_106476 [Volvox carteri f. nagariensis]|eukprot:XP_002954689.1 hypothetical protein VOLCADRAFT_106476 [Volvox carteri f. nagariensis]
MLLMYQQQQQQQQRLAECTAEEDVAGAAAAGGAASAAIMARSYTGFTPPASRGGCVGGTGGRASPIRCRTPRLSASPASAPLPAGTHLWDAAGGFVLGSFGDPAGAISTLSPLGGAGGSGGGSGGGGSPLHPSSRTMTPRSDATAALPGGAAPLTAAATAAAQLWWPLAATPSVSGPLDVKAPGWMMQPGLQEDLTTYYPVEIPLMGGRTRPPCIAVQPPAHH